MNTFSLLKGKILNLWKCCELWLIQTIDFIIFSCEMWFIRQRCFRIYENFHGSHFFEHARVQFKNIFARVKLWNWHIQWKKSFIVKKFFLLKKMCSSIFLGDCLIREEKKSGFLIVFAWFDWLIRICLIFWCFTILRLPSQN